MISIHHICQRSRILHIQDKHDWQHTKYAVDICSRNYHTCNIPRMSGWCRGCHAECRGGCLGRYPRDPTLLDQLWWLSINMPFTYCVHSYFGLFKTKHLTWNCSDRLYHGQLNLFGMLESTWCSKSLFPLFLSSCIDHVGRSTFIHLDMFKMPYLF